MTESILFETSRLAFRPVLMEDAPAIFKMCSNPEVLKFTADFPPLNIRASEKVIRENIWKQYHMHGFGRWAVVLKSTGEFTGWCGLKYRPEREAVDIGYRFDQPYWGQGIATEAAEKCLHIGFDKYNLDFIIGCAFAGNVASIRVLENIGMKFKKHFILYNTKSVWYEKWRDE